MATVSSVGSWKVTACATHERIAARAISSSPNTVMRETLFRSIPSGALRTVRWVSSRPRKALWLTGSRSISSAMSLTRTGLANGTS
ncbi:Uncharacterised protein [Mycobacteroides abscessus subsp. abscessus]|nr:Uncharacterised protein [Mycobacteroides abscessus]SHP26523.1 Uncharacterised protein [Mycobacteroides abscessus subsp. abscessus]SIL59487.1 Uncharacterised protein [Mycobacteroides abscessus subsp. abscessus]SIM27797.1 Uncharacterised protein [Mycobacteroides abscessus subsp. abscessus]SKX71194.1 Uncharacterised protein [Mycobacteroides abscessus subsp. abscessus]